MNVCNGSIVHALVLCTNVLVALGDHHLGLSGVHKRPLLGPQIRSLHESTRTMPSSTPITITPSSSCQFALKDYRSLPILIFYLSLAAFLSLRICTSIIYKASARQQQQQQTRDSRHVRIYILLATLSLFATWYYMFAFFASSYETWLSTRTTITATGTSCGNSSLLRLLRRIELWLRDTKLFKEAWQTVVETPARTWWSGQIFLWTTGWSLFLGVMGESTLKYLKSFYTR